MTAPLAERLRPADIDDMVGQNHLIGKNKMLYNIIKSGHIPNMIFYGPSGVGKTTLARIIANSTNMRLHKLNGTSCSTADIRGIIEETGTLVGAGGILLYLDEIQYLNKKQQQSLLEYIEDGSITLIASTTENPYFYVYNAILSRCTVFEFKPVTGEDVKPVVLRGFEEMREEVGELSVQDAAVDVICRHSGGDVRKALNATELCALSAPLKNKKRVVTEQLARALTQKSAARYDKDGDEHYDAVSAYQKAMRGSDPDAALHYLARLLAAGDLPSACRRLVVCACEDVGLAYPQIMPIVSAACDIAERVGLPEARIPLANAVVLTALAPKSNSAYLAIDEAIGDVESGKGGSVPRTLQNKHLDGADVKNPGQFYKYPHDFENHYTAQQYLPDTLRDVKYYKFGNNKHEQAFKKYWENIK